MSNKISREQLNPLLDASAGIENAPYLVRSLVNGGDDASAQAYASCGDCLCKCVGQLTHTPGAGRVRNDQAK